MKNNSVITLITLGIIIGVSIFLRVYKLDQVPPSISWDEAAVGYNAYTIANWGKDEWGRSFPITFKSFGDDKSPIHIYITAISVKVLGLSEFSTRVPVAIFGVLNVLLLFLLARRLFFSNLAGLIAALFMAISPYSLQFSRFNHEANVTLFFFMLGIYFFYSGLERKNILLPLSFVGFSISIISYHSAKIVVPLVVALLIILYFTDLLKAKKQLLMSILILLITAGLVIINPTLLGMARLNQTAITTERIEKTQIYKKTNSEILGRLEITAQRYLTYFSLEYLFVSGDKIARHSTQKVGEFYKTDILLLPLGLIGLFWMLIKKRSKLVIVLFAWAFLAPLPASATGGEGEIGHAARALFTMGSWHLISAYGLFWLISFIKESYLKIIALVVLLFIFGWLLKDYLGYYYGDYGGQSATEWQYGMKEAIEYVKVHDGYFQVYITPERGQPYIFFLYYLQTPLPKLLETVSYDQTKYKLSNTVDHFDKYYFGTWDPLESMPNPGVLYVLTPSQYDGLRHKNVFSVKKLVRYPNGLDAFFLVSYP